MNLRRSLTSLSLATALVAATFGSAAAAVPFKVIRAVSNANGTLFVGGAGLTVTHTSTGHYRFAFPTGTWNNGGSSCFFIPQVQPLFSSATSTIVGYSTFADGSGNIDVAMSNNLDTSLIVVFTSANC